MSSILVLFLEILFSQNIDEVTAEHDDCSEHDKQVQCLLVERSSYDSGKNDK
ncbi:MAG: hypothetical protein P8M72_05865 [Gammaproteobacteria bacterium]|nr:hypothetical protein [Gammaproteobacteria bacterium]